MKTVFNFKFPILIIGFALIINSAKTQENIIINDSINSKVLNGPRNIKIYLPEEYKSESDTKYDVVYLLDGENHFEDFSFIYNFARKEKLIPSLILVALPNTFINGRNMRERDFIPGNDNTGGANDFISFFANELIPLIDKKFSTSGNNSLFGHSLGGLFTMYVLLKKPDLFTNYYCSDPAFPWNNRHIITIAEETFRNVAKLNKTLWINGVEDTYRNVGIQKMDSVLKEFAPEGLRWKVSIYPNETHMSVRLKGIYDGLKYTYVGYNSRKLTEFHPNNGSLLEGKPAPVFLNGSFPDVYYTTDGSEPDLSSKKAPQMIEITGPAELRVKWIGENERYIITSKGNFVVSKVWPALQNIKNIKTGGLRYSYYEGKWKTLPDFTMLKAIKTGIADSLFSLEKLPSRSNFGCVFEGYLKIEVEGYYCFALCSRDGSRLLINEREIINNDGIHGSDWYKSYIVPLQKGFYPVRIEYFHSEGNPHFNLIYISPNTFETVNMPFKSMYH